MSIELLKKEPLLNWTPDCVGYHWVIPIMDTFLNNNSAIKMSENLVKEDFVLNLQQS